MKADSSDCSRIVEFVDIYPTLAELAGLEVPAELEGVSLLPLLKNPNAQWDRPAFTQVFFSEIAGYSVRTDRWRYVEWGNRGDQGMELYDQESDPKELNNLAGSTEHLDRIYTLRQLVHKNWPLN